MVYTLRHSFSELIRAVIDLILRVGKASNYTEDMPLWLLDKFAPAI